MLIEFRVENHRSLRDEQVLSMEAGRVGDPDDPRPRTVPGHAEKLLTAAGIYGANASGKSNVLSALEFMSEAVAYSHRVWEPDGGIPRMPFAWGAKRDQPTLLEVTMLIGGIRHQYGFVASNDEFLEEWLYSWPHGKKKLSFVRDLSSFKVGDTSTGPERAIEQATRKNSLYLSTAVQFQDSGMLPVYRWLRSFESYGMQRVGVRSRTLMSRIIRRLEDTHSAQLTLFEGEVFGSGFRSSIRDLLKAADVGIVDFRIERPAEGEVARSMEIIQFLHQSEVENAWLPLSQESNGTLTLFHMAIPVLDTLARGGVLLVDELESSLHPALAQEIVRRFNDPVTNPKNAQLIFTTHDTNLIGNTLGEPALRRDQVWLTEKDPEGASVLYPLTDFKPRKAENLERGYLQGRYGAIPFLNDFLASGA